MVTDVSHPELNIDEKESSIELSPYDQNEPYSIVPHDLIRDSSISPECRWLIIYLSSNNKDWKIHTNQVKEHVKGFIGRDRVDNLFKEAAKAGYIKIEIFLNEHNLRRYRYIVSKFKKFFLHPDFQGTGRQAPEDQGCLSIIKDKNYQINNTPLPSEEGVLDETSSSSSVLGNRKKFRTNPRALETNPRALGTNPRAIQECEMICFSPLVNLKKIEYDEFVLKRGKQVVDQVIEEMNDFLIATGKKYKNYAAALRNWFRRRDQNPKSAYFRIMPDKKQRDIEGNDLNEHLNSVF